MVPALNPYLKCQGVRRKFRDNLGPLGHFVDGKEVQGQERTHSRSYSLSTFMDLFNIYYMPGILLGTCEIIENNIYIGLCPPPPCTPLLHTLNSVLHRPPKTFVIS